MKRASQVMLFLLRLTLGWMYLYAGASQILNPKWSAAGYLNSATTFHGLYAWLASPANINWLNVVNKWSLLLLGLSLIFGLFVRISGYLGAALMFLFYFVILHFPYVGTGTTSFLVDQHIIFALALLYFATTGAGRVWGLDQVCAKLPWCAKHPKIRALFG